LVINVTTVTLASRLAFYYGCYAYHRFSWHQNYQSSYDSYRFTKFPTSLDCYGYGNAEDVFRLRMFLAVFEMNFMFLLILANNQLDALF